MVLPPFSSPAYSLSQNLKPKPMPGMVLTDMEDIHMLVPMVPMLVLMVLDTTVMLLDTVTWERDLLTPMLKPSHGWPTPTTDMLDTHTLPPMVPMLPQLPPTLMLLILPHTPPMEELTSSARDLLTPNQNPGMELTDTLPHTPPTVDTLPTVHTPTDVTPMADTDTDGNYFTK